MMLRRIDIMVLTPRGRILDIRKIDMSDKNNNNIIYYRRDS